MANHKLLIPHIRRWEGGFVSDPDDLGGATNKGITYDTLKRFYRWRGYPMPSLGDLRRLTDEQWEEIYKLLYWDKCRGDEIRSQNVANMLVDWFWHSGTHATKAVQGIVGVKVDGIIGPRSIGAINAREPRRLFEEVKQDRIEFYKRICVTRPRNKKFLRGWLNRVKSLHWVEDYEDR